MRLELVVGHDAEVVAAAFEGCEEIRVGGGGGGYDGAVGEDDFVRDGRGRGPAVLGGHVGEPAAEDEPANARVADAPADKGPAGALEFGRDPVEAVARAHVDDPCGGVEEDVVKVLRRDERAAVDAGVVVVGAMAARLDGKLLVVGVKHAKHGSHLGGGPGEDDA